MRLHPAEPWAIESHKPCDLKPIDICSAASEIILAKALDIARRPARQRPERRTLRGPTY